MQAPPRVLERRRVLAYVAFDKSVRHSGKAFLRAAPGPPAVIAGLAICEQPRGLKTVELCYCDSSWKIDSISIWRPVRDPFVSIEAIQEFAEEEYIGSRDKWVKVADLSAEFEERQAGC